MIISAGWPMMNRNRDMAILIIGSEIQQGFIEDSNFHFLSGYFVNRGFNIKFHISVNDNYDDIISALGFAAANADIIVTTGGLGPTSDDITRDAIADYFSLPLVQDDAELRRINSVLEGRENRKYDYNSKQAYFPYGAEIIENQGCSASGFFLKKHEKISISLPGVPSELRKIVLNGNLDNYLPSLLSVQPHCCCFIAVGFRESEVEEIIQANISSFAGSDYSIICSYRMILLVFACHSEAACGTLEERLKRLLGEKNIVKSSNIYEALFVILRDRGLTVSFAESATGGLLSALFSKISGVSSVFKGSIVSYSNEAKISLLDVDKSAIEEYGAVSRTVSRQMAMGARERFSSDIGVGITGIAGPSGERPEKPLGLFYISVSDKENTESMKFILAGDRITRQHGAAARAVFMVMSLVLGLKRSVI